MYGTPEERFWAKVNKTGPDGCWLWTGNTTREKYGRFGLTANEHQLAHRFAYALCVGKIPKGKVLDHLCRVRLCVNPEHLEPVTQRENVFRQPNTGTETHCPYEHEFTPENTYVTAAGGRQCRLCKREATRRHNARNPGRAAAWKAAQRAKK